MISVQAQSVKWPLRQPFRISRGVEYDVDCIHVRLVDAAGNIGRGEALGVNYDGESSQTMLQQVTSVKDAIARGISRDELQPLLPCGGARNAIDCALWDLQAKQSGIPAWKRARLTELIGVETAFTVGLMNETELKQYVKDLTQYKIIKIKTNADFALDPIRIVHGLVPNARLIVDPNQSWTASILARYQQELIDLNVVLLEQPLPVGDDDALIDFRSVVPIAADESFTDASTIFALSKKYDVLNIKLDKTGGLTEALRCARQAKSLGLKLMVGCMLGSSLSMAPAMLIAQLCDFVDLDGPLLQAADCDNPLIYIGSQVGPPSSALWG
jgi:L-Ala-D/L-Glu epimerase